MTPRGQCAKGIAKCDVILDVALDVISENGYRKASNRMGPEVDIVFAVDLLVAAADGL